MSGTILVIDDDQTLLDLLAKHLSKASYCALTASSGLVGLQKFYEHHPDLVVLDIMMPKMDGWTVCQRIREISDLPIVMLTAKGEEHDRLRGFNLGIDDYVVKPFSFSELVARIGAILARYRRNNSQATRAPIVRGDLIIDLERQRVTRANKRIHLTPTEFQLLATLAEQPNHVVSPEILLDRVWGNNWSNDLSSVKRYIHYLRQKLEIDPSDPQIIRTERGFGYYLA